MTADPPEPHRPPPLDGIKVLDFSRVLAGPWVTLTLADLGAEIIKIENPDGGDDTRTYDVRPEANGEAAYFLFANRSKESVALDITRPEGQAVIRRMVPKVDVLVENYRPDVMARHGLDWAALSRLNPRLVYCSISGYGHDSPLRLVAGYDPVAQAESGMMAVTGEPDGEPMRTGVSFADIFTGMFATNAVLAALRARERDGVGQFIDVALLDSAVTVMANIAQTALITGKDAPRFGNRHGFLEPFGPVEARDGLLELVIGNQRQWERMCREVLERPDLLEDPRFATNPARVKHSAELRPLLASIFRKRTRAEWMQRFHRAGVPAGSIRNVREALAAHEVRHRGLVKTVEHPRAGRLEVVHSPMHLAGTPVAPPRPAPLLGQHTAEVLARFGFSPEEIAGLKEINVIPKGEQ